jgi:hypothetical protein
VLAAAAAGVLVLSACGVGGADSALDVLSSPTEPTPDGDRSPAMTEGPREQVPSALDDPLADGLPEPLIEVSRILSGGPPPDGIPPVDDPWFDTVDEVDWLQPNEPVLALSLNGEHRAYPVQIMVWHEIVNDIVAGTPLAVTYCPLCNSALVFDRRLTGPDGIDRLVSFGTSGKLYNSDLLMYDRQTESLFSQLIGLGVAGALTGVELDRYPVQTVSYEDWSTAHPDGLVLNRVTGQERNYGVNPYEQYDDEDRAPFLFDGQVDNRLPPKRRVVGVASEDGSTAVAVDHALLERQGVVSLTLDGRELVVVMASSASSALDSSEIAEGRRVGSTGVLDPRLEGQTLTLQVQGGRLVDAETGTTWSVTGEALQGPLAGRSLTAVPHTDPFWFAWSAFYPDTEAIATG